jgi:hypothetical protein
VIIDHDETKRTGRLTALEAGTNDLFRTVGHPFGDQSEKPVEETLALRVVTEDEVRQDAGFRADIARSEVLEWRPRSSPASHVDYPTLEAKILDAEDTVNTEAVAPKGRVKTLAEWGDHKRHEAWMAMRRGFHYRYVPKAYENVHGDPPPLSLAEFAVSAPIEDVVEAVKELCENPVGVVRKRPVLGDTSAFLLDEDEPDGEDDHENTGTFALPAVWKLTGKKSGKAIAHRSAAHVQKIFNEAGWPIAVWFGEATGTYWVMDDAGLHEFETITLMYQGMGWDAL